MKYLLILMLLTACTKPKKPCMHFHVQAVQVTFCSDKIECLSYEDETGSSEICSIKEEEKK